MTASSPEPPNPIDAIAAEAVGLLGTGGQIAPFSERFPGLTLADAYRVTDAVRGLRAARGERPVGRKIGFTNRTIWDEYGVHAPIWSFVYDRTVIDLGGHGERVERTEEFAPALERAMASGKPAVLHCLIDPEAITPATTLSQIREKALASRETTGA